MARVINRPLPAWRRLLISLPFIVVVAIGARATFAWNEGRKLPANLVGIVPFRQEAGNIARSLAMGKGFSNPFNQGTGATAWLTPVYPLLLAGVFRIFGIFTPASFIVAVALNIAFSAAVCVPIFYAGRKIAGVSVGALAAWFWALFPNAIMIPYEWIWDTCLTALLAAAILWFTLGLAESTRTRDWCLYGLLWGFALMTNPALASLMPFLLGWASYSASQRGRQILARAAMAVLVVLLCCVPWSVRNYFAFHRFVPLRSAFPIALWLGHNRVFDPQAPPTTRVTPYEEAREYKRLGEDAFMRKKWIDAVSFIRAHPALELGLFEQRFVAFWVGLPSPFKRFLEAESLGERILLLANFLATLGTIGGVVAVWINWRRYAFVLSAFPLAFPWMYYVTLPYLRYRHPIDPILMLLSALALDALLRRKSASRPPAALKDAAISH
jgi:4-amino-4-deoxy-L-arabinose transferase-like glycosyltransferase